MRYDPVRLEEELFKQPVKWLVRNVELFVPLGTFVAKVIFDIQVHYTVLHYRLKHGVKFDHERSVAVYTTTWLLLAFTLYSIVCMTRPVGVFLCAL